MTLSRTIETPAIDGVDLPVSRSTRKHVLDLDDYTREELAAVMESPRSMTEVLRRDIKKVQGGSNPVL